MKKIETEEEQLRRFTFDPKKDKIVDLPNYLNHPFFQKKTEKSRRKIEKFDLLAQIFRLRADRVAK